jgi:ParB family chromosome partitioning protein
MLQAFEDIIVDATFASLIPPLSSEERQQLEENIVEHGGARDPLVVWASKGTLTLLDGHNRYEICTRLGLPFDIHELQFKSREEAEDWIDKNQLGRRNLDSRQMSLLRGRRYNRTKKTHDEAGAMKGKAVDKMSTASALAAEHGVDEKTIRRDGKFAEAVEALGIEREIVAGEIDAPKHAIVAAAQALPEKPTSAQVEQAVESVKSKPHVANNNGDNEWYTPDEYLDAARTVVGEFDLDPASNPIANERVRAAVFYTSDDDGLTKDWSGVVWMNPPYESKLIGQFSEKLCDAFASGNVTAAIVLVNNATETRWFQSLAEQSSAICFPKGRVKFWHPRKEAVPLQGQAVLYLGDDKEAFVAEFSKFGFCMEVYT